MNKMNFIRISNDEWAPVSSIVRIQKVEHVEDGDDMDDPYRGSWFCTFFATLINGEKIEIYKTYFPHKAYEFEDKLNGELNG